MRFAAYPKYKPSGVEWLGDVPEHWDVKRGRFCMDVNPISRRMRTLRPEDEVSFVPMEAVGEYGGLELGQSRSIAEIGSGYTAFDDGDVVVAKITPCFENGKGALATGLLNGAAFGTTELHVLRSAPLLERRFLFYFSISRLFRSIGEGEMYGAGGQKRVPPEFCDNVRVPLPPIDDQCAIADFLDRETAKIDTLVAKKRTLIERLKEKRTALISRTVTRGLPPDAARAAGLEPHPKLKPSGIDWLGDVPAHWQVSRIKYLAKIESGHTPSRSVDEYWIDCAIPWVSLNDSGYLRTHEYITDTVYQINELGLANSSARMLPAGAVVFSRDATVGLCAITTRPMAVSQHFVAYLCGPQLLPEYLLASLDVMGQHLVSLSLGATISTIGMDDVRSLSCAVPPFAEQEVMVEYLSRAKAQIDRMLAKVETAIDRLQEYRTALITAAVTGKIDVRGLSGADATETMTA
jgi:type I restriction enzyme S subunit